jgi:hypothetical protein
MSRYNACGMCKNGKFDDELKEYSCSKRTFGIDIFQDTSECKDFEKVEV